MQLALLLAACDGTRLGGEFREKWGWEASYGFSPTMQNVIINEPHNDDADTEPVEAEERDANLHIYHFSMNYRFTMAKGLDF
ncbi:hypothetical protein BH18GEM1_BH18GEM1_23190 [soil metagenome]